MEYFDYIFNNAPDLVISFFNSDFFAFVKFIIGIYVAVLVVDIILILFHRGLSGDLRDTLLGMNIPAELAHPKKRAKLRSNWEKIREKIKSDNESVYKSALVEADNVIDDLLKRMGYPGENMEERLQNIKAGQVENLEDLKRAHEVRKKIIHEKGFQLDREGAEETMAVYEEFLRNYEVLD